MYPRAKIPRIDGIAESLRSFVFYCKCSSRWDGAVNLLKRNNISLPTRLVSAPGTDSPAGPPLDKLENCLLRTHGLYFTPFKRCHNIIDTHARV